MELARLAVQSAGSGHIVTVPWPEEYRAIETGDYLSDISRASSELGWRPTTDIAEGIRRTVVSYQ